MNKNGMAKHKMYAFIHLCNIVLVFYIHYLPLNGRYGIPFLNNIIVEIKKDNVRIV